MSNNNFNHIIDYTGTVNYAFRIFKSLTVDPKPRTRAFRVPLALKLVTFVILALFVIQVTRDWLTGTWWISIPGQYGAYLTGVVSIILTRRLRLALRYRRFRRYQAWLDRQPVVNGDPYRSNAR